MSQTTTVQSLRAAPEAHMPVVAPGFGSLQSFELMQRAANLLASSTLVPAQYRKVIEKLDKYGNVKESRENPNALANAVVALNMAQRMGADPLMVMQNLYIVEGRPSWSSQWIIAAVNGCGRFSPLRFDIKVLGEKEIPYTTTSWNNGQRETSTRMVKVLDKVCVAWAIEKETGERLESPAITIEMAVKEGWYTKNGSKWQTMDEVMLRYRTASFFGKLYAPELLMGLQTVEEAQDIIEATAGPDGTISVNVDELRQDTRPTQRQPAAAQANATDLEARESATSNDTSPVKAQAEAGNPAQGAATAAPASQADPAGGHQPNLPGAEGDPGLDPAKVEHQIQNARSIDVLDLASDSIEGVNDLGERARLHQIYRERRNAMVRQAEQHAQQRPAGTSRRRMAAPE
ncbi:hypothetical protein [Bordetella hinzii]|uniref:hypothetical protein n=1 Tax=Bordetella hinzii TaxID=103855 RepID=UPI001239A3A3|nr:hypothetical protein [Bordetella hinzii]MBZ0073654.1 hypothetical protein [Bordetella hinzii]MBZ0077870.1 hypothetical protein [Bordetella hinzii]MBZ0082451.1 hypothetical protein [Bordetella hinzii]QET42164.1 hypothetical protein FOB29_00340 [Bordetella hinzii]